MVVGALQSPPDADQRATQRDPHWLRYLAGCPGPIRALSHLPHLGQSIPREDLEYVLVQVQVHLCDILPATAVYHHGPPSERPDTRASRLDPRVSIHRLLPTLEVKSRHPVGVRGKHGAE